MRYLALATDYDGTLATHGTVPPHVLAALQRARDAGRRLVLVTGRVWPELAAVFPEYKVFHRIVAENGALLIDPETSEQTLLGAPPPERFIEQLRLLHVDPVAVGRVIVATWEPWQHAVLGAIRDLGLELQVIFNKGAVMVLPSGVNKASGLLAALGQLGISPHNCIAVGDAENDHALLEQSQLGIAVANSIPMLKERADWVTRGERGDGVVELIEEWLSTDLRQRAPKHGRVRLTLGRRENGEPFTVPIQGARLLLCGRSGSGKSTLTAALLEQLTEAEYQYCLIDPEGDFQTSPGRVVMGDAEHRPDPAEVVKALGVTPANVVVNLLGVPLEERPAFAALLLKQVAHHQDVYGRPHWVVIDEAHHMLSPTAELKPPELHDESSGTLLVTVHPSHLHPAELARIDTVVIVGTSPRETLDELGVARGLDLPPLDEPMLEPGQIVVWSREQPSELVKLLALESREERRRHRRKYAVGELGPDKSFYFRGPSGALNLRAHNLALFLQMADGVDPETWMYHLERNDYSTWLREAVKDAELAEEVRGIEREPGAPEESRALVRKAIDSRYTLPA
jgi:hydroxymethylpyrimidine pyrophosphatase-like HAD family hydrolase/energy-coupling factor transporter ATP-binding protein EcfA2